MNKKYWLLLLIVVIVGCNADNNDDASSQESLDMPAILEVEIKISPEDPVPGENVRVQAVVSQGGEPVEDASEVKFEVWEMSETEHEMIKVVHIINGIYEMNKIFKEDGTYNIVAHVTARDQHNMPKKEILVGSPEEQSEDPKTDPTHSHDEHAHHHADGNIVLEFSYEQVDNSQEATLTAVALLENEPLEQAKVKFEIFKKDDTKHVFIDAIERARGTYEAKYGFPSKGEFIVILHLQNETIHEHTEHLMHIK
ncbi:FixH family protein [Bacillus salitolerans]|uniref:FixH family protein n=1 Tax=Bacillus salitolerans TaxID=1437434 RepID=A0ABW4LK18_9BACI